MFFSRALILAALPLLAVAADLCCQSTGDASDSAIAALLASLGITDVTGLVGVGCSAITVIQVGSCESANTVTCTDNSHAGLVSLDCVPINV
ncbi:hypothetical protein K466DRAFT_658658 [Polyporus arcularius HHB13444]|uniref:Hydrophobin n=1 Tax=Polyporus arcularius HHB13444 TaxID=1314778 RepID=A0A5C3PU58_9APHY|nr:hypothetical protein K466DRAFT_658658 [Polyporus arcularius HHB13444]